MTKKVTEMSDHKKSLLSVTIPSTAYIILVRAITNETFSTR